MVPNLIDLSIKINKSGYRGNEIRSMEIGLQGSTSVDLEVGGSDCSFQFPF